jgi:RNase adaptor protein for sRNA GlmZ degradation
MNEITINLPAELLQQAKSLAAENQQSVEKLAETYLVEGIRQANQLKNVRERIARGNPDEALAILQKMASAEPEHDDRMPE